MPRDKDQPHDLIFRLTQQQGDRKREDLKTHRSTKSDASSKDLTAEKYQMLNTNG